MTVYEEFVVHELRRIANALEGINKKMESQGAVCGPLNVDSESIINVGSSNFGFTPSPRAYYDCYDCSDIEDGSTIKEE